MERVQPERALAQAARPQQPFFSVFNHEVTHESCLFPVQELPLDFTPTDPAKVRIPPYQPDTPEMRADWARYYDHMALLDGQIAAKLKDLADAGLAENTIVFYYSDNGGVLPRSKRFLQESGTHVPLIIYFPPKWRHLAPAPPGSRIKDPVSFVDFAPTVLSLAGVKIPGYMQGRAFAGPAKAAPNEFVFLHSRPHGRTLRHDALGIDGRWLYIHNYRPDLPYVQPLEYMFQARGYQSWARMAREGKLTPRHRAVLGRETDRGALRHASRSRQREEPRRPTPRTADAGADACRAQATRARTQGQRFPARRLGARGLRRFAQTGRVSGGKVSSPWPTWLPNAIRPTCPS